MINDIVQRMSEDELAEYLRTLRSEDISRIEVIPNPPSEFEASGTGGIIHIILKKARKDGLNASVFSQYNQQGSRPFIGTGLSFDYKAGAFYLFGNGSISRDQNQSHGMSETIYPDQDLYTSSTHRNNDNRRQQYRLAMAYDLSKTQSLTLQTTASAGQMFQLFNTNADFKSASPELIGTNDSYWVRKPATSSTNLNYSWKIDSAGTLLKLIADYTTNLKTETNQFAGLYNDTLQNTIYSTSNPGNTKIFTLQADYTKPLRNKMELKAGAKYVGIRRDNITQREDELAGGWVTDTALGNHFIYSENLLMMYGSIEKSIKKTAIKLGLRAEETLSSGNSVSSAQQFSRNYFGLFPSLFVTHNDIYFSYSRRLTRPAFNELNPYRFQITQFTAIIGNPDLQPQYSHNLELGYNFSKGYSASVFYTYTAGMIAQTATPIGNNMIENQYQNFNNSQQYGINLSAPFNIRKWWSLNSNGSFFHLSYNINNFTINQTSFSFGISQGFRLGKFVSVDWGNYYRSPYVNANSKVSDHFNSDIGATVRLFKTHGRIRLTFSDIFNTTREQEKTDYDQTHIEFYQKRQTRNLGLYFSYNFNLGKVFNKKKIDQGNSDEKNRIGN
jgi:outer membrane receptor protein involved in Fe transport